MRDQLLCLASDPEWPAGPRHLIDATTIGTVVAPDPELMELLYEGTNLVQQMRIAVVVHPEFFDETRFRYDTASETFNAASFGQRNDRGSAPRSQSICARLARTDRQFGRGTRAWLRSGRVVWERR